MGDRYRIRVTRDENGKVSWELMRDGEKVDDMSAIDLIDLAIQCTNALRLRVK